MPSKAEVISLLSSPDIPLPTRKKTRSPQAAAKALNYENPPIKPANDSFIELMSDENDWPADDPAPKPKNGTVVGGSSWNFDNLGGPKQAAQTRATVPWSIEKTASGVNGFVFMEDDFDSTVNLDDSVVDELPRMPLAKKRRISPEPKPEAVQKQKTGGYGRSFSNIESSSSTTRRDMGMNLATSGTRIAVTRTNSAPSKHAHTISVRIESDPIVFTSSPDHVADAARKRKQKAKENKDQAFNSDGFEDVDMFGMKSPTRASLEQGKVLDKGKGKMTGGLEAHSCDSDDQSIVLLEPNLKQASKNAYGKELSKARSKDKVFDWEDSSDVDLPDFGGSKMKPRPKMKQREVELKSSSDLDLSNIGGSKSKVKPKPKINPPAKTKSKASTVANDLLEDYASSDTNQSDIDAGRGKPKRSKSKINAQSADEVLAKYNANREKERAVQAKKDAAQAKKDAKEAEKEEKRLEKERKAKAKLKEKEIATVNTLRTDKKLSTPEMIVQLPSCLEKKLASQTKTFLEDVKASYEEWESAYPVIKWKRKVIADFDDDEGQWKPVPLYIKPEKHVMYVMTAKDLVKHITAEDGIDLSTLVTILDSMYHDAKIIFLIEGVNGWYRKNYGIKNKQYTAAVQSHRPDHQPSASQRKRKEDVYIDPELVENALLELQVIHGFLIHQTQVMQETAQWIKLFTENISSIPYK